MHGSRRRMFLRVLPLLSAAALLAVSGSSASTAATSSSATTPKVAGTWSGRYSGAYSGTFTLHWRQSVSGALRGSIRLSNPSGTYGITGSVRGSAISFGAVSAGATYTGSVSGKSMSGRYKTAAGGGHWSAHKTS